MGSGQELWERAKTIIPGGNQLLSKRPEMHLPDLWPAYYARAKGCEIWDLDDKHYYDFAHMGVGTCVLGYADPDVNGAVTAAVAAGSMSTLNSPEEVALAEKLVELHPWAEMVRYSRAGGEACAIAIRIARAATGRGTVAFCGYHGWHDWYIAANIGAESNLDGQLLPGLEPNGIARQLGGTVLPFNYNKIEELRRVLDANKGQVGAIMMEPERSTPPAPGFLEQVRKLADEHGCVLIFDEVTSGFRVNPGGYHLTTGVNPDIAVFGKALGNGFPISAVVGRRAVMDAAQSTFISSTYWTEKIGFAAGLATLNKYVDTSAHEQLVHFGKRIRDGWEKAAEASNLEIGTCGLEPLSVVGFKVSNPQVANTFFAQEMLKRGYLVGPAVYTTTAYSDEVVDRYLDHCSEVFAELVRREGDGSLASALEGPVKHDGFRRLN